MATSPLVLLIDSDTTHLAHRVVMLKRAGYATVAATGGKDGLVEAFRHHPLMIIVSSNLSDLKPLELVRKLRADPRTADTKILLLSPSTKPDDILAGMQAGVNEYILERQDATEEFLERLRVYVPNGVQLQPLPASSPLRPGKLIAFLSAKGGTGTSTVCANMAHLLAEAVAPKLVAVVDLVLPLGSLSQITGLQAPVTVVEASKLSGPELAPGPLRQKLTLAPEWQFYLLPGVPDPEAAQALAWERFDGFFTCLQQAFDYVLVDWGRTLSRFSVPLLRNSEKIVVVLNPDPTTVALTETMLNYLEQQEIRRARVYAVLNRALGLEGMSFLAVEHQLSLKIAGTLPHMGEGFALANNQHHPFAVRFPDTAVAFALHELTNGLLTQLAGGPQSRSPKV
jgi:pilus assembly protein CpaE